MKDGEERRNDACEIRGIKPSDEARSEEWKRLSGDRAGRSNLTLI
jgi:hypothetical protein